MSDRYDNVREPSCDICGSDMEWQECWNCGGEGGRGWEDLQFEDPFWYDEDDWIDCDQCDGEGGWWLCLNYKNHPAETSAVAPDTGAGGGEPGA